VRMANLAASEVERVEAWSGQLQRIAQAMARVGPDEICCEGLTARQTAILRTLVKQEGARLADLAAASGITPSAMTRVIEKLEAQGMVQRVRGAQQDGRAGMVKITAKGRKARQRVDEMEQERTRSIVEAIPVEQRAAVLKALREFAGALECCGGCCVK